MSIKEIFCQDKVIRILQRALAADKVPHAYIFAGLNGVGRFTTARQWAKILLCSSPIVEKKDGQNFFDSCRTCQSCTAFEAGSHPDFQHIYKELVQFTREGKNKKTPINLPIAVIREFLIEKVAARPALSQKKVYIVSEAEKLTINSQNALLKVLEEPPKHCFIILLCSRLERLLPTTKSRCQIIRFGPVDSQRIADKLSEMGADDKQALYWARFAQGSLGSAIKWATLKLEATSMYKIKKQLVDRLSTFRLADALDFAEQIRSNSKIIADAHTAEQKGVSVKDINRSVQKVLLRIIALAFSDAMKAAVGVRTGLVNSDQLGQIETLAEKLGRRRAAEQVAAAYNSIRWIDLNVNDRLVFEQLLLNYAVVV